MATNGPTKAELQAERDVLWRELERTQRELETFKNDVRERAIEVAQDQGWCQSGLNETLDALGLPTVHSNYTVTLDLRLRFDVDLSSVDLTGVDLDDKWFENAVRNHMDYSLTHWAKGTWSLDDEVINAVDFTPTD